MTQAQTENSADITQLLNEGKVAFTYKTKAGETRNAIGTTKSDLIPEGTAPANSTDSEMVTYYDLNVNDWRNFSRSNLDTDSVTIQS
jgi:hypothetical protein